MNLSLYLSQLSFYQQGSPPLYTQATICTWEHILFILLPR